MVHAANCLSTSLPLRFIRKGLHWPANFSGTVTIRIELSAPPDTSNVEVGLKRTVVIGNSWALSIDKSG
jgi:hypothetical protein